MGYLKTLLLILTLAFMSSCVALKETNLNEEETLTEGNISKLEGLYELKSENSVETNFAETTASYTTISRCSIQPILKSRCISTRFE